MCSQPKKKPSITEDEEPLVSFRCTMCGQCCQGYGGIFITPQQMKTIARFLGLQPQEFFDRYCEILNGSISIKSGPDGYCLLWDQGCTVHPVKPDPCRRWPFFENIVRIKDNWLIAKNNCPGILPRSTYEDFLEDARRLGYAPQLSEQPRAAGKSKSG